MKIKNPINRLLSFWGRVDRKHIEIIASHTEGDKVLDLGAGFGTTSSYLKRKGYSVTAVDFDEDVVESALNRDSTLTYLKLNAEKLSFEDHSFDTLILRDSLHHFYGEADFTKVKMEIDRVLRPGGALIVFDPNINWLLKTMRKLSSHVDEECTFEEASDIVGEIGYEITHTSFNTLFSLPLSGGYVGINFVPQVEMLQNLILFVEKVLERLIQNKLGRQVAWRYLIVGRKPA